MHIFFYFNIMVQFLSFSGTLFLPLPKMRIKEQEARVLGASCSFIKDEN